MFSNARERARRSAASVALKAAAKAESVTNADGELNDIKQSVAAKGADGLMADSRAQSGAEGAVNLVVALVVGGLMAAFLLPIAIDEISGVDTSSWDGGAAALWGILPVMIVLAVFLFFVGVALKRSGRI